VTRDQLMQIDDPDIRQSRVFRGGRSDAG